MTDVTDRWNCLLEITRDQVIRSRSDSTLNAKYEYMLSMIRHDRVLMNGAILLGMARAPGSRDRHHNSEGGLVEHILEMWNLWGTVRTVVLASQSQTFGSVDRFTDTDVWRAILHHDLNKVWRYELTAYEPWTVQYTAHDVLAPHTGGAHKTLFLLQQYEIPLSLELYNAVLCAEGGFSHVRVAEVTPLGKIAYILDELSANVAFRLSHDRFWDPKDGGLNAIR